MHLALPSSTARTHGRSNVMPQVRRHPDMLSRSRPHLERNLEVVKEGAVVGVRVELLAHVLVEVVAHLGQLHVLLRGEAARGRLQVALRCLQAQTEENTLALMVLSVGNTPAVQYNVHRGPSCRANLLTCAHWPHPRALH